MNFTQEVASAALDVSSGTEAGRNANAERQARFRDSKAGQQALDRRNTQRMAERLLAKELYNVERRSAVADCVQGSTRLRAVGLQKTNDTIHGWASTFNPFPEVLGL